MELEAYLSQDSVSTEMGQLIYQIGKRMKINMGRIMFEQIVAHATSTNSLHQISFSSLIYELIISQHPNLKTELDTLSRAPALLSADQKLFKGRHANDLKEKPRNVPGLSVRRTGTVSGMSAGEREMVLTELEDTLETNQE